MPRPSLASNAAGVCPPLSELCLPEPVGAVWWKRQIRVDWSVTGLYHQNLPLCTLSRSLLAPSQLLWWNYSLLQVKCQMWLLGQDTFILLHAFRIGQWEAGWLSSTYIPSWYVPVSLFLYTTAFPTHWSSQRMIYCTSSSNLFLSKKYTSSRGSCVSAPSYSLTLKVLSDWTDRTTPGV